MKYVKIEKQLTIKNVLKVYLKVQVITMKENEYILK